MLDEKNIAEFKEELIKEKNKLEGDLSKIAKPTDEKGGYETQYENIGSDSDENATEVSGYNDKLALENDLEKQLKDTNDALKRIEDGTYGVCDNCSQEIPIERLKAYPAARNCIKCD